MADFRIDNHRILRWSLAKGTKQDEIMLDNIQGCPGLAMDDEGALYIFSDSTSDVGRFTRGNKTGTVVAGRNRKRKCHSSTPYNYYIAVDGEVPCTYQTTPIAVS